MSFKETMHVRAYFSTPTEPLVSMYGLAKDVMSQLLDNLSITRAVIFGAYESKVVTFRRRLDGSGCFQGWTNSAEREAVYVECMDAIKNGRFPHTLFDVVEAIDDGAKVDDLIEDANDDEEDVLVWNEEIAEMILTDPDMYYKHVIQQFVSNGMEINDVTIKVLVAAANDIRAKNGLPPWKPGQE